ncbi:PREDICTED: armadillo repeat-containing protein 6 homolog [Papilio polytes]|uniref:armadillo repeat-containing protein 6 homolog n=1 Tax=Papilio polytes TaxID=76194 RepID=UPI0006768F2B|nr:PREDICTED: armadillo repeat-containing protein 6 homolog [Papilio polytes]
MVRVITQETYDEVVKENMDEFDMSPEEAVKEAIAQFEAQGVDLSNIIKELNLNSGEEHLVSSTVKKLKELSNAVQNNEEHILEQLDILMTECNKDIAHRVKAGKEGCYTVLINLLEAKQKSYLKINNVKDSSFIIKILNTFVSLMESQPDLLDRKGVAIIKRNLDEIEEESILIATLKWTSVCCVKHEMNRQMIFGTGIGRNLNNILNKSKNIELLSECLQVIRKLTLDDDVRVEFGKAHEHARELGAELLDTLTRLLENNTKPPLVSDVVSTIACLLVRHELCALAAERGAAALFAVLADNYDDVIVVHHATKLITAMSGNDDVKRQLVQSGIVPIIVSLLDRFASNASVTAQTLRCVSALALREPAHARQLLDCGAPEPLAYCLKLHPNNAAVQKNGCWAIRNMVARCRDYNSKFKELGIEEILNNTYATFGQEFGFDIKSALRDLECDVALDEQWTGRGVQMTN